MTRLLFWIALVILVIAAIRSKLRKMGAPPPTGQGGQPAPRQPQRPAPPATEKMLQCAHCGVHFPSSENVPAAGRDYCCAAHAPQ
ncbi:PP0621 family protein [Massilia sp. SR12]